MPLQTFEACPQFIRLCSRNESLWVKSGTPSSAGTAACSMPIACWGCLLTTAICAGLWATSRAPTYCDKKLENNPFHPWMTSFSWKYSPGADGLAVRSGIFAFHQFRFLSVEGRLAHMGADDLFQLGHKVSQVLVASVQPISKLGADRHGFLIRSPSLC
jgi:hypothetical protein